MSDGTCGCPVGLTTVGSQAGLCIDCAQGKFKNVNGRSECTKCTDYFGFDPQRHVTNGTGTTIPDCGCANGYYLAPNPAWTNASELWKRCGNQTYRTTMLLEGGEDISLPWMPFHKTVGYPEELVTNYQLCREREIPKLLNSSPANVHHTGDGGLFAYASSPSGGR